MCSLSSDYQLYFPDSSGRIIKDIETSYKIISKDTHFAATSGNPIDTSVGLPMIIENRCLPGTSAVEKIRHLSGS